MPKSSKKKKEKAADFTKAKLKLGKGKQAANNAVDTSFKARSIAVPQQTIGQEKQGAQPTTRRNLTLDELLLHLKHYNPNTRKDAVAGLRELLEGHPFLMDTSLTSVIQACARIVGDEEAEVRKSLVSFLNWFLRTAPLHLLRPHIPMLLLFVTSAQTHIFPAIRIDAVRILDLLVDITPDLVVQNWTEPESTGARVLEGYLGLLSVGSNYWKGNKGDTPMATTSSVTLSTSSRLAVLTSLAKFLTVAISSSSKNSERTNLWYMANVFSSQEEFQSFVSLIDPSLSDKTNLGCDTEWTPTESSKEEFVGQFKPAVHPAFSSAEYSINELSDIVNLISSLRSKEDVAVASKSPSDTHVESIVHLAKTLNPIMVSTWLDVAPTLFGITASSSKFETEAKLAQAVVEISICLYGAIYRERNLSIEIRSQAVNDILTLLNYMSPYLPRTSESNDPELENLLRTLSLSYCELTSMTALASQHDVKSGPKARGATKGKQFKALSTQLSRVGEYVTQALNGELKSGSNPMGYSLPSSAYSALLPTVWSLVNFQSDGDESNICATVRIACINHAKRTSSKAAAKAPATQFVGILLMLYGFRGSPLGRGGALSQEEINAFAEWLQHLPQVLWELGVNDPALTEIILRILLRITQRGTPMLSSDVFIAVGVRFAPFFSLIRPEKGTILGPFSKLTQYPRHRRLALDVSSVILHLIPSPNSDILLSAVDGAVKDPADVQYWSSIRH